MGPIVSTFPARPQRHMGRKASLLGALLHVPSTHKNEATDPSTRSRAILRRQFIGLVDDSRARYLEDLGMSDTESPKEATRPKTGSPIEVAPAGSTSDLPRPANRRLAAWISLLVVLFATGAFLVIRPDLPPRTDFDAISRLVASNAIMNMELRKDTLTVTKRSGERLRLEGITTDQYRRLQPIEFRRLVAISPSNNLWSLATELAAIASSIVPALVGAALALVAQTILRRRRMRPAAG